PFLVSLRWRERRGVVGRHGAIHIDRPACVVLLLFEIVTLRLTAIVGINLWHVVGQEATARALVGIAHRIEELADRRALRQFGEIALAPRGIGGLIKRQAALAQQRPE